MTDLDDVVDRLEELEDKVDSLEAEKAELRDRADRAERIARAATAHSRRLWSFVNGEEDRLTNAVEGLHARISGVQQGAAESSEGSIQEAESKLPIQQLADMPEPAAKRTLDNENHRNSYRARFLWKDFDDYASRTAAGWVLESGDMQRVLRAAEKDGNTRIESKTAGRVMDRLVEFTRGIARKQKRKGTWEIVVPHDWKEQAVEMDGRPDTAATPATR